MSFTLRSLPSSSELRTISSAVSSIVLLLPLKSNRCASSFCACWMALATSCMSVFDTTSNENSCAIRSSRCRNDFHARRRREAKELRRNCAAAKSREIEYRPISFAIRILNLLHEVGVGSDGQGEVSDRGGGIARLE